MRTVRDADGTRYLLVTASDETWHVRDPETGTERRLPAGELDAVEGESPLATAARAVPEPPRRLLTAVRDARSLGLLVELDERGPLAAARLLEEYDLCESDLHGTLTEFRAAGLVDEATVAGRPGYAITDAGSDALSRLRD